MAYSRKDRKGRVLRKGETQRKCDGKYVYTYMDTLGRRRSIYSKDIKTLREREEQLIKDQLDGLDIYVAGSATVNFVFDRYISTKSELRETTRTNYKYMYDRFVKDGFGKKKIAVIKFSDVLQFYQYLLKDKNIGKQIVPIIADEARTFGMEGLFRQIGIYSPNGQQYTPQDREQVAYYKEDEKGQILQEGINELGAGASWLAAATSYSTNNLPMIPFYIYYSMFGFQRIGDLCWAAGDQQARGFLIGGTSGRTTLNGEGLQHEDGHSHIQSLTIPNCISYDPSYAYEVAVIMHDGLERMYGEKQENVYYYITTLNENYHMPAMPAGAEEGIRKGIYKLETVEGSKGKVQLLGSGSILRHVREAAQILAKDYGVGSDVYSVPSFTELARDGQDCERWNMLHPLETPRVPYIAQVMNDAPAVASTDYMKLFAEQVRTYVPADDYRVLGTDGFGRSDSRENLRHHFEVDASYVVVAALGELAKRGEIDKKVVADAIIKFNIDAEKVNPRLA